MALAKSPVLVPAVCGRTTDGPLAAVVMEARHNFALDLVPLKCGIDIAHRSDGMTLVSDSADAPAGGAAADSAVVLREVLDAGADRQPRFTLLTLCDPGAAAAGAGAVIDLRLGYAFSTMDGTPVAVTATVLSVSDGCFVMQDAGAQGVPINMGMTAVLEIGAIRIVVCASLNGMGYRGLPVPGT